MKSPVIGIDVGKYELDVFWNGKHSKIKNDEKALLAWIKKHKESLAHVSVLAYEATGCYERTLHKCLHNNALPYLRLHANHVRNFAKSIGQFAKTDKIDAGLIALYVATMKCEAKDLPVCETELKALTKRREQLVDSRKQEKCRLDTCEDYITPWIHESIECLETSIKAIEKAMNALIQANPELTKLMSLYQSVPGIGSVTATQLIVDLPELLNHEDKPLAALVGISPMNKDSGKYAGKRRIRGGRTRIRSCLYMAAMAATQHNEGLKAFYEKLRQKGRCARSAYIAVAHKLLRILRSVAQRQTVWTPVAAR